MAADSPQSAGPCPAGWHKDMFNAAPHSPCVVTTFWHKITLGTHAVVSGLMVALVGLSLALNLRRPVDGRRRTLAPQVILLGGVALPGIASSMLWADPGTLDSRAEWRALWLLGFVLNYYVAAFMLLRRMITGVAHFTSGLDPVRCQQLGRWVAVGAWANMVSNSAATLGLAVALFGTTTGTRGTGAVLYLAGASVASVAFTTAMLRMLSMLAEVRDAVDQASGSAHRVARMQGGLRKAGKATAKRAALYGIIAVLTASIGELRVVAGTLAVWPWTLFVASFAAMYVRAFVAQWRQHWQSTQSLPMPAGPPSPSKVFPEADVTGAIASHIACASSELRANPTRHAALCAEEDQPDGLAHNGVSLAFMKQFVTEYSVEQGMTAADMCALHIKPATQDVNLSLVAVLQDGHAPGQDEHWVGAPSHFISYAWSFSFHMLIEIVELHEQEVPPATGQTYYYFIDQFSLNQHKFVDTGIAAGPHGTPASQQLQEEVVGESRQRLVATLKAQMLKAGHVLVCLWPLEAPTPLRRVWCLFEIWVALQNDIRITMCFGSADTAALHDAVRSGSFDAAKIIGNIRAQDAGCTLQEDKDMMLDLVENEMGIERFNTEMQEKLFGCMQQAVAAGFSLWVDGHIAFDFWFDGQLSRARGSVLDVN